MLITADFQVTVLPQYSKVSRKVCYLILRLIPCFQFQNMTWKTEAKILNLKYGIKNFDFDILHFFYFADFIF